MIKTNTHPPHTNLSLIETSGKPIIIRYPNSCLAPSSTSNTTVYLVGVSPSVNGRLEINSIDLSDINSPYINTTTYNEEVLFWRSQSTLFCHNYPSYKSPKDTERVDAIHVQQFEAGWTFDTNIYPTSGRIDYPSYFPEVALTSAKNYMVVGHSESASWSLAHTNTTNSVSDSTWTTFQLNPIDSFKVFSDDHMDRFPTATPFLSVGTYNMSSSKLPARGHAIVFDTATSGWIYPTAGYVVGSSTYGGNMLQLESPVAVSMENITLTREAVAVSMGFDAYILDKQTSDNTTVAYYINPVNSTKLQRVAMQGHSPRYSSSLVATSMGSKIAVYSSNVNGPRFNTFDPSTRRWAGLGLDPQDTIATAAPPLPTNIDSDFSGGSHTSTLPLPSIIGGVLGGLFLVVLAIFFFLRYRSRHRKNNLKQRKNYDRNSKSELLEKCQQQECQERMISVTNLRSPQFNPAQPCPPLPPGRSLGRNPQSPVLESIKFFPAHFDSRGSPPTNPSFLLLQCPLTAAAAASTAATGMSRNTIHTRPDLSLSHHHAHPSSSSLAPTLTDLTYQQHPSDISLLRDQHGSRSSSSSSLSASATTHNRLSQAYSEGASNFEHMSDYVPSVIVPSPSPSFHPSQRSSRNY